MKLQFGKDGHDEHGNQKYSVAFDAVRHVGEIVYVEHSDCPFSKGYCLTDVQGGKLSAETLFIIAAFCEGLNFGAHPHHA
jgi:hypothetical protein